MQTSKGIEKRTLGNIIDISQYIVSTGVRRIYREKLVLYEDGTMRLNNTFVGKTSERRFAVAFSKDFHKVVIVPNCEPEIQFSKNGNAKDVDLIKNFKGKNNSRLFPLTYNLSWDDDKNLWSGELDQTTKQ